MSQNMSLKWEHTDIARTEEDSRIRLTNGEVNLKEESYERFVKNGEFPPLEQFLEYRLCPTR
jgi:hypothetical protein